MSTAEERFIYLGELTDKIKASVWLHLKKEEEELFPLLLEHKFEQDELNTLSGHILGNRSSELVNDYIEMIMRDLPASEHAKVINSIITAAKGTRFSHWLRHIGKDVTGASVELSKSGRAAAAVKLPIGTSETTQRSYHQCQSKGVCCDTVGNEPVLGCIHYRRKCKLYFECCDKLYACRICHDEDVTSKSVTSTDAREKWHIANRYEVQSMWCMVCETLQPCASHCVSCGVMMAKYFCAICNLFDDAVNRPIYHCPFCNVCRVGLGLGKDQFHCMNCNACMSTKLKDHKCVNGLLEGDCAVCQEKLFFATRPVHVSPCGHVMHRDCFHDYVKTSIQCPVCRRSIFDVSEVWNKYDEMWSHILGGPGIAVDVHCFDCQRDTKVVLPANLPDWASAFPSKCSSCGSYNTKR
mmetsp:Transcript_2824/g.4756  ORF Transcript_2824/g.4756 Transcript_2824/m.4756 type:complete len:410 (-) Transcript_2824:173-1402(-)